MVWLKHILLSLIRGGSVKTSEVAKQTAHQQRSAYQILLQDCVSPTGWVLSQGNEAQRSSNPLHWLTAFSHFWPRSWLPPTCVICLRRNEARCHVFVCLCYIRSKERIHFQLSHSTFKTSSQMLLIWRVHPHPPSKKTKKKKTPQRISVFVCWARSPVVL